MSICKFLQLSVVFLAFLPNAFSNSAGKYHIPAFKANWFKANEFCNSIGMRLVTISSQAENDAVGNFIRSSDNFNPEGCWFWTGASDLAEDRTFTWMATGRLMTYTNWGAGEPNEKNNDEHCVEILYWKMRPDTFSWNDLKCTDRIYFICESKAVDCVQEF